MDKENSDFSSKFNVTIRNPNPVVNSTPLCLNSDAIFNSTAKNSADLLHGDTDLSLISNIGHDFTEGFFPNALIQNQPNSEQNVVDLPSMQTEIELLYTKYLQVFTMTENLKSNFKEGEDIYLRDILELHKAEEAEKRSLLKLKKEEMLIDNLLKLIKFMDSFNAWMKENHDSLNSFQSDYKKLAELCAETNNHLVLKNIYIQSNKFEYEEMLKTEMDKTCALLKRVLQIFENTSILEQETSLESKQNKIDYNILDGLNKQYNILKSLIVKCNGIEIISNCTE